MSSLTITSKQKSPGVVVIALDGSLDTETYLKFDKKIDLELQTSPKVLILDMAKLLYISSIGVRSMLRLRKALQKTNGSLRLVELQPQVKKVFEIINALPSQQIFTSTAELDEYLDCMQRKVNQ